jgi:hypothetical protein
VARRGQGDCGAAHRVAAALGECDDLGADPAGITFPKDAQGVEVWAVEGAEPDEAVARKTDNGYQVFASDSLGDDQRSHVLEAVGLEL